MTIKERIAAARLRLGDARADEIIRNAERKLGAGHFLTLAQQANHLETGMEEQGITAVWRSGARAQPKPDEKTYDEWMAEYDAIENPAARTAFFRKHLPEMRASRVRMLYPSAYILKPRKR